MLTRTQNCEGSKTMEEIKAPIKTGIIELPKLDVSSYIGKKAKLERITEMKGQFGYCVKIETEIIAKIGNQENPIELRGSRIFGLFQDKEGNIGWSAETKLGQFLAKHKVPHYNELAGKEVILQTNTKEGQDYLTF